MALVVWWLSQSEWETHSWLRWGEKDKRREGKGGGHLGVFPFLSSPLSLSLPLSRSLNVSRELCAESRFSFKPPKSHRKQPRDVILHVVCEPEQSGRRHNERAGSQRENAAASGSESRTDNALSSLKVTPGCLWIWILTRILYWYIKTAESCAVSVHFN